jgi:hypothetical protein
MKLRKDNDKVTMMAIVSWWMVNQLQKLKKERGTFEYSVDWMPSDRILYVRTVMYPSDIKTNVDIEIKLWTDGTMLIVLKHDSAWFERPLQSTWENERLTLFDWERIVLYIRGILEGR